MISTEALNLHVKGLVQGVGFRPFVYRMALRHHVAGWVLNAIDGVHVHAEGDGGDLDRFALALADDAPEAARVAEVSIEECPVEGFEGFEIRFSEDEPAELVTLVSPDIATCGECERELFDPENRRYRYPFINCTNCGPRFTIIRSLPYDRNATSMEPFEMCADCAREYGDPADRRFHAQPDACFECGPSLSFQRLGFSGPEEVDSKTCEVRWGVSREASDEILAETVSLLASGGIVAVKGLGGFHLACDADNAEAVARLRERKRRDGKAFAVMVPDVDAARCVCLVDDEEAAQLRSPQRPIVLLRKRPGASIGRGVADRLSELGVMLPSTPVQMLLMRDFVEAGGRMLVMTSGNLHDEPIVVDDEAAAVKFSGIADAILGNNRAILSRYDDSVLRVVNAGAAGKFVQMVRRARGFAPAPIAVGTGEGAPTVFAAGPEQKNTFAYLRDGRAFVSQHVGDLEDGDVFDAWVEARRRMSELFRLEETVVAADMHPGYLSTQWAESRGVRVEKVQHHHAHIVSVMAENGLEEAVCGIAFDGTGYGVDGAVWGGEVLLSNRGDFERFANFSYVPMPGGAAAVRNPLRMAYGVLWDCDLLEHPGAAGVLERLGDDAVLLGQMIEKGINTPYTSSVGRLFDAASALLGVCVAPSYQGEGAVLLEAAIADEDETGCDDEECLGRYAVGIVKNTASESSTARDTSVVLLDARPVFEAMLDDVAAGVATGTIARRFHKAVVGAVVQSAQLVKAVYGIDTVVLAGGVFMNRYLVEHVVEELFALGFVVAVGRDLPPNDGAVSLGQAVVVLSRER